MHKEQLNKLQGTYAWARAIRMIVKVITAPELEITNETCSLAIHNKMVNCVSFGLMSVIGNAD